MLSCNWLLLLLHDTLALGSYFIQVLLFVINTSNGNAAPMLRDHRHNLVMIGLCIVFNEA